LNSCYYTDHTTNLPYTKIESHFVRISIRHLPYPKLLARYEDLQCAESWVNSQSDYQISKTKYWAVCLVFQKKGAVPLNTLRLPSSAHNYQLFYKRTLYKYYTQYSKWLQTLTLVRYGWWYLVDMDFFTDVAVMHFNSIFKQMCLRDIWEAFNAEDGINVSKTSIA